MPDIYDSDFNIFNSVFIFANYLIIFHFMIGEEKKRHFHICKHRDRNNMLLVFDTGKEGGGG